MSGFGPKRPFRWSAPLAGVLKKVNPKVTVLYHYVTFTPANATDQERGVKEIKKFGYNGVVIQSQDADIFFCLTPKVGGPLTYFASASEPESVCSWHETDMPDALSRML
jgi:hypothetical protein